MMDDLQEIQEIAAEQAKAREAMMPPSNPQHDVIRRALEYADHEGIKLMAAAEVYNKQVALITSFVDRGAWAQAEAGLRDLGIKA